MRRMNYPRFDKPTYTGTFDLEQSGFVINATPEPGFYFIVINDPTDGDQLSLMFTIDKDLQSYVSFHSALLGEDVVLSYLPGDANLIQSIGGAIVSTGSTIELYKLN